MVLGTSKIDPDPPKSMLLLKREHDFQKIMLKKKKTDIQKNTKNYSKKPSKKRSFFALFRSRSTPGAVPGHARGTPRALSGAPGDPRGSPGAPRGLLEPL